MNKLRRLRKSLLRGFLVLGIAGGGLAIQAHSKEEDDLQKLVPYSEVKIESYPDQPPEAVLQTIKELLEKPLTVDAAVQVAVLNNRSLQSTLQELGIAKAELWQTALIKNPNFEARVRRHTETGDHLFTDFTLTQDIVSLFLLPSKRKLGRLRYDEAKLKISDEILQTITDTKSTYYDLKGLLQTQSMFINILDAEEAARELLTRQLNAGNISRLEYATQQTTYHELKLQLLQTEASLRNEKEHLNKLMGLTSTEYAWTLEGELEHPSTQMPSLDEAERMALDHRTDLAAAREEVKVMEQSISVTRRERFPSIALGANWEQDPGGGRVAGPVAELEIPLFNRKQADIAGLKAGRNQSRHRLAAMEAEIRSEIRMAHTRMSTAQETADYYHDTVIPLRREIVARTQQNYNYMLAGVYQLLQAKQQEITARKNYVEALKDYWMSSAELERAVGGRLPEFSSEKTEGANPPEQPTEKKEEPMPQEHHHHH